MKFNDVFKTNAINMIIGRGDYNISALRNHLLKSFSIVDYDGFNLSGFSISKGQANEKPPIMIIDMRGASDEFASDIMKLLNDYVRGKYYITLVLLCGIKDSANNTKPIEKYLADAGLDKVSIRGFTGNLNPEPYIDCESTAIYMAECILKFIDENSYEVMKSLNCVLYKIIHLED